MSISPSKPDNIEPSSQPYTTMHCIKSFPEIGVVAMSENEFGDLNSSTINDSKSTVFVFYSSSSNLDKSSLPADAVTYYAPSTHSSPERYRCPFNSPTKSDHLNLKSDLMKSASDTTESLQSSELSESPKRSNSVLPNESDELLVRSRLDELKSSFNWSLVRSESVKLLERSKSVDQLVTTESIKLPIRETKSEPILRPELGESDFEERGLELLFTHITRNRREIFVSLFNSAGNLANHMEKLRDLRETKDKTCSIKGSRWKENDAIDWFEFHNLWDSVIRGIDTFRSVLEYTFCDFNEDMDIFTRVNDFYSLIAELGELDISIFMLLKMSTNCYHKFQRFCASVNESTFLKNASDYRRKISCFHKKLKVELEILNQVDDFNSI